MQYSKMFRLDQRVAVVIGGGSGIGAAAAHGLAAFGATLVVADIKLEAAERTVEAIRCEGGRAIGKPVDIRQYKDVDELLQTTQTEHGKIDILVTTPSMNIRKPLIELETDEFEKIIDLNLKGTFHVLKKVGSLMAERGRGSIIALSSIRASVVEPGQGVYAATKAGIVQMARALAAELGPRGVRVNALAPGVVETPLTEPIKNHPEWYSAYARKNALGRWALPQEIAGSIVFLASDASSYITGTVFLVDGGWTAIDGRFEPPV